MFLFCHDEEKIFVINTNVRDLYSVSIFVSQYNLVVALGIYY